MTRQQVPNVELRSDTARANLLTNGGFEVWQRGNGPFTGAGAMSADRWPIFPVSGTISVSRDTANAERGACAAVTTTGSDVFVYQEFLRNTEGLEFRNRILSASVRVKASVANAVRIAIMDASGSTTNSAYHSGGGAYETLAVTSSAVITPASTNAQVRVLFSAAGTFYIDNAMLVVGSVAADYAPLHPADDLARCLRYYETTSVANGQALCTGSIVATTVAQATYPMLAVKAVTPTVTIGPAANFLVANASNIATTAIAQLSNNNRIIGINATTAGGLVVGQACMISGGISLTGTLSLEANP